MQPAIQLRNVSKRFLTPAGTVYTALRDLTFEVGEGEFCAVVGPTGCGKSTTLGLISGLEPASEGEVQVHGRPVSGIADGIGYVFQTDAVFPWKSVLENVAAGPRYHGASPKEARERARDWIARVGLAGFEDRYPHQLSGGRRRCCALAPRATTGPCSRMMDECFVRVDVQTWRLMVDWLLELWSTTGASGVVVTHDLAEAIAMSDRVVVLTAGPGSIKGIYEVDLPRPRKVNEIRFDPKFSNIYEEIWSDLREEVMVSYERAKRAG